MGLKKPIDLTLVVSRSVSIFSICLGSIIRGDTLIKVETLAGETEEKEEREKKNNKKKKK